jgi:hypothetical protein
VPPPFAVSLVVIVIGPAVVLLYGSKGAARPEFVVFQEFVTVPAAFDLPVAANRAVSPVTPIDHVLPAVNPPVTYETTPMIQEFAGRRLLADTFVATPLVIVTFSVIVLNVNA